MIGKEEIQGLIVTAGGVYCMLMAKGVVAMSPDSERSERLRRKFGRMFFVFGPLLILFGIVQLFGLLR